MSRERAFRGRTLLFVLVQLALVFLVLEVGLRLARRHFKGLDRLLYLPEVSTSYDDMTTLEELLDESLLGFRPFKGSSGYILNSRGLRTPEYEIEKPPGTYRVVVLGDSFAYASGGTPFGYHWPYLMGRDLEQRLARPVEVVNLGAPGVGPAFYYRMWQIEGSHLGADQVVLSFFIGNDLTDERGLGESSLGDEGLVKRLARWSLGVRAARALYLLRGLEESTDPSQGERDSEVEPAPSGSGAGEGPGVVSAPGGGEPIGGGDVEGTQTPRGGYEVMRYRERFDPNQPSMRPEAYLRDTGNRMKVSLPRNEQAIERRLDRVFPLLAAIRDEVEAGGGRFTVMLVPDEYQVSESVRRDVLDHLGAEPGEYDLRQPQNRILERCEAARMDCLDLLPAFESASGKVSLYKPRDTHWSLEGNALAAQLLAEHLTAPTSREEALEAPIE